MLEGKSTTCCPQFQRQSVSVKTTKHMGDTCEWIYIIQPKQLKICRLLPISRTELFDEILVRVYDAKYTFFLLELNVFWAPYLVIVMQHNLLIPWLCCLSSLPSAYTTILIERGILWKLKNIFIWHVQQSALILRQLGYLLKLSWVRPASHTTKRTTVSPASYCPIPAVQWLGLYKFDIGMDVYWTRRQTRSQCMVAGYFWLSFTYMISLGWTTWDAIPSSLRFRLLSSETCSSQIWIADAGSSQKKMCNDAVEHSGNLLSSTRGQ